MSDPAQRIRDQARALGFHALAFARADEPLTEDHERYGAFIDRGMHGEMSYLADNRQLRHRLDDEGILRAAKTVVCLARRYDRAAEDEATDPPLARAIARYARGRDYHNHLRKRLGRLAAYVRDLGRSVTARALCDTAPVLERAWAARSGLGFIGKNGMLIVPGQGSYCLLGEVVTSLEVGEADIGAPCEPRCGSCSACLECCPTGAFVSPYVLDARRCIAYATIEARGLPPEPLREAVGGQLFGCDVCQQVCPYNQVAPPAQVDTEPFQPLTRWGRLSLADLVTLDEARWLEVARGTPLKRAARLGLTRNALLFAARRLRGGHTDARGVLELALSHDEPELRGLATQLLATAVAL